jgi:hypothetical protein
MKLLQNCLYLSAAIALSTPLLASETMRGVLNKSGADFIIETSEARYQIVATRKVQDSLPSLESPTFVTQSNGKRYAFEFKGEIRNNEFHLNEVPTNVAGTHSKTGILHYDSMTNQYKLGNKRVKFGFTKVLNGYEFDEISKQSFVGQKVIAEGYIDERNIFVMEALTPVNLFSADLPDPAPENIQRKMNEMGHWNFLLREMAKNENSQSKEGFRTIIAEDKSAQVEPGDSALIITLGGRQGDTFGSVNGHFVAGLGKVLSDMTLQAEVSNAYVTNSKDILSGNTSLTNYFSHTVQGQNNYRPTYTLIAYGVDSKKLKQFRDALEESHIRFRTNKLDITPQFNCTTETVKALAKSGIKGNYKQYDNHLKGLLTIPLALPFFGETPNIIHYSLKNDSSRFHPTAAYYSFVGAFLQESFRNQQGIKRVDFVFYPQIPSNRPVGGISLGSIWKVNKFKKLYEKYEVNEETLLSPEELRPLLEQELKSIPYL